MGPGAHRSPTQTEHSQRNGSQVSVIRASLMVMISSVKHHFQLKLAGECGSSSIPPMSRRALNAAHCLRPLILVVIKVPLWWPQREVATGQAY